MHVPDCFCGLKQAFTVTPYSAPIVSSAAASRFAERGRGAAGPRRHGVVLLPQDAPRRGRGRAPRLPALGGGGAAPGGEASPVGTLWPPRHRHRWNCTARRECTSSPSLSPPGSC